VVKLDECRRCPLVVEESGGCGHKVTAVWARFGPYLGRGLTSISVVAGHILWRQCRCCVASFGDKWRCYIASFEDEWHRFLLSSGGRGRNVVDASILPGRCGWLWRQGQQDVVAGSSLVWVRQPMKAMLWPEASTAAATALYPC
jgi:hypothetical protein